PAPKGSFEILHRQSIPLPDKDYSPNPGSISQDDRRNEESTLPAFCPYIHRRRRLSAPGSFAVDRSQWRKYYFFASEKRISWCSSQLERKYTLSSTWYEQQSPFGILKTSEVEVSQFQQDARPLAQETGPHFHGSRIDGLRDLSQILPKET
ncbi:hypothetical protein N7470_005517, partial [Penicillium chermesinum]